MSNADFKRDEALEEILEKVRFGEKTISSQATTEIDIKKYEVEKHSLEEAQYHCQMEYKNDIIHYRGMRKDFADKVYYFLIVWCICLLGLLITKGSWDKFNLSNEIIITLCGGTTISSIGLVGFVVKGLFNGHSK